MSDDLNLYILSSALRIDGAQICRSSNEEQSPYPESKPQAMQAAIVDEGNIFGMRTPSPNLLPGQAVYKLLLAICILQ